MTYWRFRLEPDNSMAILYHFRYNAADLCLGKWCTVSKVHTGHDDATLERLQEELAPNMEKIKGDHTRMPSWIKVEFDNLIIFVITQDLIKLVCKLKKILFL